MVTKLKRFNDNRAVRATAFILCIVFFIVSMMGMVVMKSHTWSKVDHGFDYSLDDIWAENYEASEGFLREISYKMNHLQNVIQRYKSEDYIKSGKAIMPDEMNSVLSNFYYTGEASYGSYRYMNGQIIDLKGNYLEEKAPPTETAEKEIVKKGKSPIPNLNYPQQDIYKMLGQFKEDYADEIALLKKMIIQGQLDEFNEILKDTLNENGILYYASDGKNVITNIDSAKTQTATNGAVSKDSKQALLDKLDLTPFSIRYENDELKTVYHGANRVVDPKTKSKINNYCSQIENRLNDDSKGLNLYLGFQNSYIEGAQKNFAAAKTEMEIWIPVIFGSLFLCLFLLIYLVATTGRRNEQGAIELYRGDKLFTEIHLILLVIIFGLGGSLTVDFASQMGDMITSPSINVLTDALAALSAGITGGLLLWFFLACIRKIKAKRFFKDSIIVKLFKMIGEGIIAFYRGGGTMRRVVLIALGICLVSATMVLAPVAFILILIFAPRWVKKYEEIKKGVKEVRDGNLKYKIPISGNGELEELARGINQISAASNLAIQNELKNQRLKTDLISNVSHDLKTPLTSIITYIDLLKKEGLNSEAAPKYLEVLDQKSQRLKKLTEDLFDAAKASSGAIPVTFERVDMLALIYQGLGEMSDRMAQTRLEVKVNADRERYYVNADGQLLWRVVENLLGNVLKYAQEGSRVYVNVGEETVSMTNSLMVVMEIKNISRNELNITADELMERFKRGDESRTTEGSGLGLAIAKDLITLQKGQFEISIDGDLFKATAKLQAYEEQEPMDEQMYASDIK